MAVTEDGRSLRSGDDAGTAPEDRRFRPDVQGLRAVAVVLVVLAHCFVPHFENGFIGVDVFFVISGFVITGLLLREAAEADRILLLPFYARRARRIIPAAVLVIAVTLLATRALIGGNAVAQTTVDARWTAGFLGNFTPARGTFGSPVPSPLGAYWSLGVEEQFYLVYPLLVGAVLLIGRRWSFRLKLCFVVCSVFIVSFIWSVLASRAALFGGYSTPWTRAWELAAGCLLAIATGWIKRWPKGIGVALSWTGLLVIALSLFEISFQDGGYPGYIASLPVLGAALVIAGGSVEHRYGAEAVLRTGPFQAIGRWSFALYLWHYPVLVIAAEVWGPLTVVENLLLCIGALGLSAATYAFVENPLRHSVALRRSPVASIGLGLGLVAMCLILTLAV